MQPEKKVSWHSSELISLLKIISIWLTSHFNSIHSRCLIKCNSSVNWKVDQIDCTDIKQTWRCLSSEASTSRPFPADIAFGQCICQSNMVEDIKYDKAFWSISKNQYINILKYSFGDIGFGQCIYQRNKVEDIMKRHFDQFEKCFDCILSCDDELEVTKAEKMKAKKRRQILTKKTITKK